MTAPAALLAAALARDPSRPLITYYDDATGERVELSGTTLDNWVAKTANLLRDDLAVAPGETVALLLPAHWQTAAVVLASWAVGAVVAMVGDGTADGAPEQLVRDAAQARPDVVVAGEEVLDAGLGLGARETLALSLRPFGAPLRELPADALDYALEVPVHGDRFAGGPAPDPSAPALSVQGRLLTGAEVSAAVAEAAGRWAVGPGDRVLSTLPFADLPGLLAGLLVPLATGAGAVLCRNLDPARLDARVSAERVLAVAGVPAPAGTAVRLLT